MVKYSLWDQYWNKYDSFENIKYSVLFVQVNMQEACLILWYCAECEIWLYAVVIFILFLSFYHVGDKEIIKQRIPKHKWNDWITENDFL